MRFALEHRFDHIQIEGEHGFGKPEERAYKHAMEVLEVGPQETWMVGDNLEWEILAPQRLGIYGIWHDAYRVGLPADSRSAPTASSAGYRNCWFSRTSQYGSRAAALLWFIAGIAADLIRRRTADAGAAPRPKKSRPNRKRPSGGAQGATLEELGHSYNVSRARISRLNV